MRPHLLLATLLLATTPLCLAAGKPKPKPAVKPVNPFVKNTEWTGKIVAIDAASITVVNDRALTRAFLLTPGTVLGRDARGKLADYKIGGRVAVSFSEIPGTNSAKAESLQPAKPKK